MAFISDAESKEMKVERADGGAETQKTDNKEEKEKDYEEKRKAVKEKTVAEKEKGKEVKEKEVKEKEVKEKEVKEKEVKEKEEINQRQSQGGEGGQGYKQVVKGRQTEACYPDPSTNTLWYCSTNSFISKTSLW